MLRFGIDELDKLNFPERVNLLLYGPPSRDKLLFTYIFTYYNLSKGNPVAYITTDKSVFEIKKEMFDLNMNISQFEGKNLFRFIDCYSWSLESKSKESNVIYASSPSALNELAIAISKAKEQIWKPAKPLRLVFNSISTLLLYNRSEIVYRFLQVIGARLKNADASSLLFLEKGMHEEKVFTTIEHLTDGTIEIDDEKKEIKISRIKEALFKYKISEGTFVIEKKR